MQNHDKAEHTRTLAPPTEDVGRRMPLDFSIDDKLMALVRVRLEPFSIEMPSKADIARMWQDADIRVPMPTDKDMARLERRVWETLPKLRENLSSRRLRLARMASGGSAQNSPSSEALEWENRVREMSFDELVTLAEANGVQASQHPNPGLRVMQTRNSLYRLIRTNGRLEPAQAA